MTSDDAFETKLPLLKIYCRYIVVKNISGDLNYLIQFI